MTAYGSLQGPRACTGSTSISSHVCACRIQGRSRNFYLQAMQWILSITSIEGGMNGYEAGVVFENLWYVPSDSTV